jgi:WS/DGAT/MGAT family acyltransferase
MAAGYGERLSGLDRSFLALESPSAHMHLGAVLVFEGDGLVDRKGTVDLERLQRYTEARLPLIPRYRQRLLSVVGETFWVDDAHFDLRRHLRHVQLTGGGDVELKQLAGEIASQPLDRGRPLWEIWVVDGLDDRRFALLLKAHHCLADGLALVALVRALLSLEPLAELPPAVPYRPRPAPGLLEVLRAQLDGLVGAPLRGLQLLRGALGDPARTASSLWQQVEALTSTLLARLRATSPTPFNAPIGPHRRVEWREMELGALRALQRALGGSLNDCVLALVTSALRRYLVAHGLPVARLDLRALVPVSVRDRDESGTVGNRLALWLVDLPVEEADPRLRHEQVRAITRDLKRSDSHLGGDALARLSDWTSPSLLSRVVKLVPRARPFNLLVTNIPGPPVPLYLLTSRLAAAYPLAPLFEGQGLGVALLSYSGRLYWGLNADRDLMPDLDLFAGALIAALEELRTAAASPAEGPPSGPRPEGPRAGRSEAKPSGDGNSARITSAAPSNESRPTET